MTSTYIMSALKSSQEHILIIPLAKWDDAKRQPSSSEDAGVMYYYPVAGLFLISGELFYAADLVCLRTPTILEQYLMSSDTGPLVVVRSTRRLELIVESYTENISKKYRFSLDRSGQHVCLIVINENNLSYPIYNDSSFRGFNFIHLTRLRSSTYFTKNPSTWTLYHDASDVWASKYHVDCITHRLAKLKLFILYFNLYSRLLKISDLQHGREAVKLYSSNIPNLLSALPREILSKIAWMAVLSQKFMLA